MTEAWAEFHKRFPLLEPPQAVTPDLARRFAAALAGRDERVLLLGVTPALAGIGRELVAVDWSPNMIAKVWPGDDAHRWVVEADWRSMRPGAAAFTAAIGDGSLNCTAYPHDYAAVFARLAALLGQQGRIALRFFVTPDHCESVDALAAATLSGRIESVHALKWRLAMAACAERGIVNIPVVEILALFNRLFPDREALGRATGWTPEEIATLDFYRGTADVLSFPTMAQIRVTVPAGFSEPLLLSSGDYPLAERCPLVVMEWTG
jgi:hypothetical protein